MAVEEQGAEIRFRPTQLHILQYTGGKVGVSAAPGSGKTFTLSHLAARLVARLLESDRIDDQEVLVVTFSNSAVNSIKARVAAILQETRVVLPYAGYRVRTLHGLAHDIVRERPALVGLADDFQIIDERVAAEMRRTVVDNWVKEHGRALLQAYANPEKVDNEPWLNRTVASDVPKLALGMAEVFIHQAKDRRLTPADLKRRLDDYGQDLPLARFAYEVYDAYQRNLAYRGAVDFDDLVRLALVALDSDKAYLKRLRARWPYILEDEAQDSSQLQETLLRLLSRDKNWVRVGDPNQAINTTFTTAHPRYLRAFLERRGVKKYTLEEAGRSALPIIALANELVRWACNDHDEPALRDAFREQVIRPVAPDDSQPNPGPDEALVYIHLRNGEKVTPERELDMVAESLVNWLPDNPDRTVAVLVPENKHGFQLAQMLRERRVPYEELLRSTTATRETAERLRSVLEFLASPLTPGGGDKLARLYTDLWWPQTLGKGAVRPETTELQQAIRDALAGCKRLEAFLWPEWDAPPLRALELPRDLPDEAEIDLEMFRQRVRLWLDATILPIDQLMLTLGQTLFTEPNDLALTYKLAQLLRGYAYANPQARLKQYVEELRVISQNERRFLGFEDAEVGYTPKPGQVTIATMHSAKGLEWDRVYLLSVNNYSFPGAQYYDKYQDEKWYVRDQLNLKAEALAQLDALTGDAPYREGDASLQARLDFCAERLRLLYVGITRARRELLILWNTGRFGRGEDSDKRPAVALMHLSAFVTNRASV
ncbi:MAG: ATP-dependent helicase [Anaerolineae bacterium]|nr:ATP-dependent helicase [Anaerolineae bacterium]